VVPVVAQVLVLALVQMMVDMDLLEVQR
jgi:hypothetical protein